MDMFVVLDRECDVFEVSFGVSFCLLAVFSLFYLEVSIPILEALRVEEVQLIKYHFFSHFNGSPIISTPQPFITHPVHTHLHIRSTQNLHLVAPSTSDV